MNDEVAFIMRTIEETDEDEAQQQGQVRLVFPADVASDPEAVLAAALDEAGINPAKCALFKIEGALDGGFVIRSKVDDEAVYSLEEDLGLDLEEDEPFAEFADVPGVFSGFGED